VTQHNGAMTALFILFGTIFGALIGSFLNVVLWRVPRGESIVRPPSHCPACNTELTPRELVPILSWVAQRGRCRSCGTHISARYPLIEAGCAVVGALVAWLLVS
jgi:leader peptidase (prepilin peptidase)/N-methyltransferase